MTDERRYEEDEVAAIFENAASPRAASENAVARAGGLTLAELQAIGREVGVAPDRIAEAAAAIDGRRSAQPRRTILGVPISVGRSIDLPRAPTDREWEMLLVELRETFGARGRTSSQGSIREWWNGNLHAYVEPTESGYRLRIGTVKGSAGPLTLAGAAGMATGLSVVGLVFATSGVFDPGPLVLGGMGAAAIAWNAVTLPAWASRRERQMQHLAARAAEIVRGPVDSDLIES